MTFYTFDGEYIRRLTEGNAAVEEHFASYFGELLYLKLRTRLRQRQLIEDVRQETLMRVLKILRQKGGVEYPERFGAFVNSVSNNVLLEFLRAEKRQEQMPEHHEDPADTTVDLDAPLVNFDRRREVERALADLPRKDRDILRAMYYEDADRTEVCRRFRVNGEYLRVMLHRAKQKFRKAYQQHEGERRSAPPAGT